MEEIKESVMKLQSLFFPGIVGTVSLFALSACQGPQTATSSSEAETSRPENGTVLFHEKFSDAGMLQIVSDASGNLNASLQANIGSEAEKLLISSSTQSTLADVYRSLHDGLAEVPALVEKASGQIEQSKSSASPEDVRPLVPPLAKAASENGFRDGYCHEYSEGLYRWRLWGCNWYASANRIEASLVVSGDRITAWNATPWTATMSLLGETDSDPSPNTWRPTVPPYTVNWFMWGGTYHYARARATLPSGKKGELGMALHYAVPIVK